jgi:hypothetical protein
MKRSRRAACAAASGVTLALARRSLSQHHGQTVRHLPEVSTAYRLTSRSTSQTAPTNATITDRI